MKAKVIKRKKEESEEPEDSGDVLLKSDQDNAVVERDKVFSELN